MEKQQVHKSHSSVYRPPRPDDFILQEVKWNLSQNGEVDARFLDITVRQGVVKLRGEVATPHQKKVALEAVRDIPGVKHVENQLKIMRVARFTDDHSMHGF